MHNGAPRAAYPYIEQCRGLLSTPTPPRASPQVRAPPGGGRSPRPTVAPRGIVKYSQLFSTDAPRGAYMHSRLGALQMSGRGCRDGWQEAASSREGCPGG